jgi:hypothetical protein
MDEYVKQSIDARKNAIFNTYEVNADGKKKVDELFSEIEKLGAKCKDAMEFESEFAKSPLNQKYLDLFTEVATNSPVKSSAMPAGQDVSGDVAKGVAEEIAEDVASAAIHKVVPTRAAVHQKAYDAARDVPILGDAINIGQKASYAAHLGKLFGKHKNKE